MNWLDFLNIKKGGLPLAVRTALGSCLVGIPAALLSTIFTFPYEKNFKIVISLFAALIISYIFKENRTAIDKIRNYDYSKFNIKKKQRYSSESSRILASGNDTDTYNILYYAALLILPMIQPKQINTAWADLYIACALAAVPFVATIFYFIFFNERKKIAEAWIAKLDQEKRIEEQREKMLESLKKAINSHEAKSTERTPIELAKYLENLANNKEPTQKHDGE